MEGEELAALRMMTCCNRDALRFTALFVGCLAAGSAYTLDAFTVYSSDLKEMFEATQSQVNSAISMGYVGLLSSLPTGLLYRRLGPRLTSTIALAFSMTGSILLFTTLYFVEFYKVQFAVISAFYFLMGFGGGIMYVTASSVSMTNFEDELLGLISGVIHAFRSGIPGLLMVLDMYTFSPDYNSPEYRRRRLIIMFATLAILYTIANILGIVFYGDYRKRKRYHSVLGPHASQSVTVEKSSKFSRSSRRRLETTMSITESTPLVGARRAVYKDWWKYLKEIDYHLIFWPSIILLGFRTAFGSNISTFAASYGLQTYAQIAMSILPIVSTFSKPPIGWCSDALLNVVPRSIFLFTWSILVCIIVSLCLVFFAEAVMQGIALMMIVIASSYIQTLAPPLLVAMFGRTFFPIGWSLITVGWAGLTSLFNVIIGHFYDANIVGDGRNCLGNACYRDSFIIALSMSVLAALGLAGLVYRERAFRRDHEDTTAALEESVNT